MAMFLSRLKQVLNLGTKSITSNGTYYASSDGYDGYSSVSVTVPQITPTSITPSNSSPVALTANTAVTPTASGYAIASYDSVTPSSTPTSVSTDDIVKIGGSGVVMTAPSSLTPSNSSPATITSGNTYTATANGKAVASVTDMTPSSILKSVSANDVIRFTSSGQVVDLISEITPNNNTPPSLGSGNCYLPLVSGYAIGSYSSKTPSDSSPASVSSGAIIKASAAGYLYASSGLLKGNISLIASGYITDSNNYYTYTFSQAITTCLVVSFGDSGYSPMTYTGTGTATSISTSTGNPYFNSMKIKNVKSGDTVKIGKITISGNNRKMYAIFSIT